VGPIYDHRGEHTGDITREGRVNTKVEDEYLRERGEGRKVG
jgi:hypothetical protein